MSTLIFFAKHIPKGQSLKSIKIKMDSAKWQQFQTLFAFLSEHFAPRIEYRIIGKIPDSVLVVELELHSLSKWSEVHHVESDHVLTQTVRDLVPRIFGNGQQSESTKQLLSAIKHSLSAQRGEEEKALTL